MISRKKGRPKKGGSDTQTDTPTETPSVKGRKKKETDDEPEKQKKKRGRKAAVKYFSSSIRKQIPLTTVIQEKDNFILHLDVKDSQVDNLPDSVVDAELDFLDVSLDEDVTLLLEEKIKTRNDQDKVIVTKLEELHLNTDTQEVQENIKTDNVDSRIQGYFNVLGDFYLNSEWLRKTDVWCWWCCHPFDTVPIGLPVHYDEKVKRFRVKGVFCSFSCMVAYRHAHEHKKHSNQVDQLILSLYKQITGSLKIESTLRPAPPRCSLKCFGGKLEIEEFRNVHKENKVLKMVEYPMFISRDYIEEIDIKNVKNANVSVFLNGDPETQRMQKNTPKMKLQSQIDKTTILTGNTIDKFISDMTIS